MFVRTTRVNALVLQSSFGVTFVSDVVFLKMPSRQEKKRRAKYFQVRDDVLEAARASYKADIKFTVISVIWV